MLQNAAAGVIHRVRPLARVGPVRLLAGFSVFDHGGGFTQTSIPLRSGVGFRPRDSDGAGLPFL